MAAAQSSRWIRLVYQGPAGANVAVPERTDCMRDSRPSPYIPAARTMRLSGSHCRTMPSAFSMIAPGNLSGATTVVSSTHSPEVCS